MINLINKEKENQFTFLQKLRLWFSWSFSLSSPVKKCQKIKAVKRSLIGNAFYFLNPYSYKIHSPLKGFIARIYPDNTIHLVGENNLQVLVMIKFKKDKLVSIYDTMRCQVREKQRVSEKTVLFTVFFQEHVLSIVVLIPWQPSIIGKIDRLPSQRNKFVYFCYRNPWPLFKSGIKRHGEYEH